MFFVTLAKMNTIQSYENSNLIRRKHGKMTDDTFKDVKVCYEEDTQVPHGCLFISRGLV